MVEDLLDCTVSLPFCVSMSYLPNLMPSLGALALCPQPPAIYCRPEHDALCQESSLQDHPSGIHLPALVTQGPQLFPHLSLSQRGRVPVYCLEGFEGYLTGQREQRRADEGSGEDTENKD